MEDGEKDEEIKPRGEAWEMRVRDIPGDEREGLPPEKMLCDWLPPEVEHFVAALGRVSF